MSIVSSDRRMYFGAHYFSMRTREALFVVLVRTRPYKKISTVLLRKGRHLLTMLVAGGGESLWECEDEWRAPLIAGVAEDKLYSFQPPEQASA
jgi:hypothetical protein